jgi:hypothetical protein
MGGGRGAGVFFGQTSSHVVTVSVEKLPTPFGRGPGALTITGCSIFA